jgi:hypothetical protein
MPSSAANYYTRILFSFISLIKIARVFFLSKNNYEL